MQDVKKWFKRESGKKEKENKGELKQKQKQKQPTNRFTKAGRNADMNLLIEAKMACADRSQ